MASPVRRERVPLPEITSTQQTPWDDDDDDDIVITGISGRFPESDNVKEFWDNLMNKVNMTSEEDRRFPKGIWGLPPRLGTLKDLSKFDAVFFGVHGKQADAMDPQIRILLECTYEAMVDAGYDPAELSGTKTAVFVGASNSETRDMLLNSDFEALRYILTGCASAMFANRISYTFNLKGPSLVIDTACSSSFSSMHQAVQGIRSRQCDAAIVCGSNVCLHSLTSLQFHKLQMLSPCGICKAFDASADGYVRAETIAVAFLQRRSQARRIYATVTRIVTNTDGAKEEGITFPSLEVQCNLIESSYNEANISTDDIAYVEAHGTGTRVGDPAEAQSIAKSLCKNRKKPLLIGTVKSNIGHSEPSSGIGALVKVLLAIKEGIIPPTINYTTPNPEIESLINGQLKIVTEPTKMEGEYVGINNFGFGGVNVHLILKRPTDRSPPENERKESIPRLVLSCGRTEEGVSSLLKSLETTGLPAETYGFINNLSKRTSMLFRGFALMENEQVKAPKILAKIPSTKRPVWFVFSGMGTQWPGMGQDLLRLDPFSKSIYRSAEVLKPYGIDLMTVFTTVGDSTKQKKREIVPAFVSIAAIQVALVDTLFELGISPDGIVGHSVGELGCAYADGCLTAQQMVLSAYWRGKCVEDAGLIDGAMAAVGLTWEETKNKCPDGVLPACHNAEDTVTISGPTNKMKAFVQQLNCENIFVREVDSCGYAFHCSYVNPAASALQKALETVIPNPKPRSHRWICSSIPESDWNNPLAKRCSAAYLVNNLVSSVLFREALLHVPSDAIVIEIGPHCLLQSILKRSLSDNCVFVGLMNRREKNNLEFFLSSVGNMYNSGINPAIEKLYPKITYPVPRGVPLISPLIKWDHSQSWKVVNEEDLRKKIGSSEFIVEVDVSSSECEDIYLTDHRIDRRILFPATGYILLAWKALAEQERKEFNQVPVEFEELSITRATLLSKTGVTRFLVSLLKISGEFEISEGGSIVSRGKVRMIMDVVNKDEKFPKPNPSSYKLDGKDVYKELRLRGYDYGPAFQSVLEAESSGRRAKLKWNGNWVTFLDGLLQISVVNTNERLLFLPNRILRVKIDPRILGASSDERCVEAFCDPHTKTCISEGVYLKEMKVALASRRQDPKTLPVLEEYKFVPNVEIDVLENDLKRQVLEYLEVCATFTRSYLEACGRSKEYISDVMNGFKEAPNEIAQKYTNLQNENFVLLNCLKDLVNLPIAEHTHDNVKRIFKKVRLNVSKDIISNAVLSERALRTALDVVTENLTSHSIKIVEVSAGLVICEQVQQFLISSNILLKIDYTITHPKPDTLDDAIKSVQWDTVSSPPNDIFEMDLVIAKDVCSNQDFNQFLQTVSSFLKDYGFILLIQRTNVTQAEKLLSSIGEYFAPVMSDKEIEGALEGAELSLICKKYDGVSSTVYLLRKMAKRQITESTIIRLSSNSFIWVKELKRALYGSSADLNESNVWLVAEDSPTSGVIGMVNCLRKEVGGHRIRCFFNASNPRRALPPFNLDHPIYKDLLRKDLVMNVIKDDQWGTYRHISLQKNNTVESQHAFVNIRTVGDLSTLQWMESPLKHYKTLSKRSSKMCSVYYSALNFKDIVLATGRLAVRSGSDFVLGTEYSGRYENGKRIMGIQSSNALATSVVPDSDFIWNVPDRWTLEEACTVPVVYVTVYYALIVRGNLQRGETILIHSGSGGIGQAAIAVASSMDCEVFTTVGSMEKRKFLKQKFPQLKEENFFNSRDITFEDHILRATNGEGVDVVLNSLTEEKLQASFRCIKSNGRFLEIGKYDSVLNNGLGMEMFLKNVSFHGIHVDHLAKKGGPVIARVVQLVQDGIEAGVVVPIKAKVYGYNEVEDAYRFMASGRHVGKLLIKIREEENQICVPPSKVVVPAVPRVLCHPERVYVVCGGLGGFGMELADWLINCGAKRLVLTSRSGIKSGYQRLHLQQWHDRGVEVIVSNLDVCDYSQAENLISEAKKAGVIGGIFNLAVVLRDGFLKNLTEDDFETASRPKVVATRNLDKLSRKLCPNLEWFVVFSSVSCGRGNAGQSNYGYANSVMERICEKRTRDGLHGLAIQWGAIGDVGLVFEGMGGNDVVIGGTLPQRMNSCLSTLEVFLTQKSPVVSSLVPSDRNLLKKGTGERSLLDAVVHIFGIKNVSSLNPSTTLGDLGMDSLMAVETKQILERDYDLFFSTQELRMLSLKKLKEIDRNTLSGAKSSDLEKPKNRLICKNIIPTECMVQMNDVKDGPPLFVIPSAEGLLDNLRVITNRLNYPAYGLQSTADVPDTSISAMALHYCELIKSKLQAGSPCYILGYSFGCLIALEVATELQKSGNTKVKLFFLEDDSNGVFWNKKTELKENEDTKEAKRMATFLQQFANVSHKTQLIEHLLSLPVLKERLQHVALVISVATLYRNKEEAIAAAELYLKKSRCADDYKCNWKFKGRAILFTTNIGTTPDSKSGKCFELSEFCDGATTVHVMDGNGLFQEDGSRQMASLISKEIAAS